MVELLARQAIRRLSQALELLQDSVFDVETLRVLLSGVAHDAKHASFIEQGLAGDRVALMHGVMGCLSHYEAELEKNSS